MLVEGCRRVLEETSRVRVRGEAVARAAEGIDAGQLAIPSWDAPGMYEGQGEGAVAWLLAYNAINYCYWPDPGEKRWHTLIDGQPFGDDDEAVGIMAAFARSVERGGQVVDPEWLSRVTAERLAEVLPRAPGAGPLPMIQERLMCLRELGRAYRVYDGPVGLVRAAEGSAVRLVDLLVNACPTWDDFRTWGGVRLLFRKRAQLCVAMIRGRLKGQGLGHFPDLEPLTAFADYRLPQSLQGLGILVCDEALRADIAAGRQIEAGSEAEVALRAATVVGAEELRAALVARGHRVNALHVDYFLWRYAVDHDGELPRFHRTRTTDY